MKSEPLRQIGGGAGRHRPRSAPPGPGAHSEPAAPPEGVPAAGCALPGIVAEPGRTPGNPTRAYTLIHLLARTHYSSLWGREAVPHPNSPGTIKSEKTDAHQVPRQTVRLPPAHTS
jgi:hypothetical protein